MTGVRFLARGGVKEASPTNASEGSRASQFPIPVFRALAEGTVSFCFRTADYLIKAQAYAGVLCCPWKMASNDPSHQDIAFPKRGDDLESLFFEHRNRTSVL